MTYWFDPMVGGGGGGIIGGDPNRAPAMSSAQINASMGWNPAAQAQTTNLYGPGGFGAQTAYYAGQGAAYGRQTGGYGGYGAANADPFTPVGGGGGGGYSGGGIGSDARFGGQEDIDWYLGGSQGPRPSENAARQYGWDANEGAPAPAAPQVYNRGEFNPQTYGWDANEGVADTPEDIQWYLGGSQGPRPSTSGGVGSDARFGGQQDIDWYLGGSQGPRPSEGGSSFEPWRDRIAPQVPTSPSTVTVPAQQSSIRPVWGGAEDVAWMQGGSQGPRPSNPGAYGGREDIAWMLAGSQGSRPSSMMEAVAGGTPSGTRSAVPDARTYMPSGQFGGYLDHYLWGANSGNLGASGIRADPFGGYVPQGGANDPFNPYAAQLAQQGGGGIGSDARYGGQGSPYGAGLDMLRGGQGWTIAQQPQAVSQEMLGNRINQGIYDIGNAGDYYSRSIGGGFGMNMPNQSQGLTAQDLDPRSAYPPGFRMDQQ